MTSSSPMASAMETVQTITEARLRAAGITSVELGCFHSEGRENVAVLVDDEDAGSARSVCRKFSDVSVFVFTSSGRKAGCFRLDQPKYETITLAALPFRIAQSLLDHSEQQHGLDALNRFRIAVYVKTYFGSVSRLVGHSGNTSGDVPLEDLRQAAAVDPFPENDRSSYDEYLADIGWRPPIDMLERLGLADPWIHEGLLPRLAKHRDVKAGLTVFFCREQAIQLGFLKTIQKAITDTGFEVLQSLSLEGDIAFNLRHSTRGGNWGAGPFPVSGGPPVHLIFAVDVFPVPPSSATLAQHPFLDNAGSLSAKVFARDAVLKPLSRAEYFNPLHSSDNSSEALRIAETVLSDEDFEDLSNRFAARMTEVSTASENTELLRDKNPVAALASVACDEGLHVRKIYRPQFARYADLLECMLQELSPHWPEFPKVLTKSGSCVDVLIADEKEFFEAPAERGVPVKTVFRLREALGAIVEAGFAPIGWTPRHGMYLSKTEGSLRFIDIDTLRRLPTNGDAEEPTAPDWMELVDHEQYRQHWRPFLGVPQSTFFYGSPGLIHFHRLLVFPSYSLAKRCAYMIRKLGRLTRAQGGTLYHHLFRR